MALAATGTIAVDALGFLVAKGSFDLAKLDLTDVDDGNITTFDASALSLSTELTGFAGVGASLSQSPVTDVSTLSVVTTDAIGFSLTNAMIDLIILQDTTTLTNKYVGLEASLDSAQLIGTPLLYSPGEVDET